MVKPLASIFVLLMAAFITISVGCLEFNKGHALELKLLTKAATAEYLIRNPEAIPVILDATAEALYTLQNDTEVITDLAQLDQKMMDILLPKMQDLTPEAQSALLILFQEIKEVIVSKTASRVEGAVLPEEAKVQVITFLTWVHDQARLSKMQLDAAKPTE